MDELFALFDPDEDVAITHRNLPHWQQSGRTYFITFRTDDSLPRAVIDAWYNERNDWLKQHGIEPQCLNWRAALLQQPATERRDFHQRFSEKFHRLLDECHGRCVLKQPDLARIVGDSLLHFDGQRYEMGDFVVMPNHVHMIVQLLSETDMKQQCESWKHWTATRINRKLGQKGHFWQSEGFDHLVRSPEQFDALRRYIAENPVKARLREGEYLHYIRK
jgi:putative transposase